MERYIFYTPSQEIKQEKILQIEKALKNTDKAGAGESPSRPFGLDRFIRRRCSIFRGSPGRFRLKKKGGADVSSGLERKRPSGNSGEAERPGWGGAGGCGRERCGGRREAGGSPGEKSDLSGFFRRNGPFKRRRERF
jgi:hypothetical protein